MLEYIAFIVFTAKVFIFLGTLGGRLLNRRESLACISFDCPRKASPSHKYSVGTLGAVSGECVAIDREALLDKTFLFSVSISELLNLQFYFIL